MRNARLPRRIQSSHRGYALLILPVLLIPSLTFGGFAEVGGPMGVANTGKGRSVVWTDFDGDGWLDMYVGNVDENNLLFQNRMSSGLPFIDVAPTWGVTNTAYPSWSVVSVDYDNDGDADLYVANDFAYPCRLYRNDGGSFADVAVQLGATGAENDMGVGWTDLDRDGDLDFILSIWGSNLLYRGDGRGGFRNISSEMGTGSAAIGFQVAWADWDGDGDQDLYNANLPNMVANKSHLYRNDGSFFADVSLAANPLMDEEALGASWADWDLDGDIDLFTARGQAFGMGVDVPNRLWRNDGGVFVDVAATFGAMGDTLSSSSGVWADYDLDGDQDLFVSGTHAHQLWRNDSGSFVDVAALEGLSDPANTGPRGSSWGDYDRDGDPDLVVVHRGGTIRLWRNDTANGNHWLTLHLRGVYSNRDAIGARVLVTAGSQTQTLEVNAGDGYFSQQSLQLEVGVGTATSANITVKWPSGIRQDFLNVPVDQEIEIVEDLPLFSSVDFEEIGASVGVDDPDAGRGSAWADYDADGDLDLYVANSSTANRLWRNDGGIFSDVAPALGVDDPSGAARSVVFADYDNDGLLDLYVSNLGGDCRLYHNAGSVFADVAPAMGLVSANKSHWGAAWADFDGDGDVDLYQTRLNQANSLYRNDGSVFADVATLFGVALAGRQVMPVWGDYDADGLPDLYVTSRASNILLHNDGSTFTNVTAAAGLAADTIRTQGAAWGDADADGDLDLYVANDGPSHYYENQGNGTFLSREVSLKLGFPGDDNSPVWIDWDADGKLDLTLVSNGGTIRFLRNNGAKFRDLSVLKGIDHYGYSQSAGWADFDDDGDVDLHVTCDGEANQFYRRVGTSGGNWLRIRLEGTVSNRAAIGAKIEVETAGLIQTRYVQAGSGWLSQGDLWPHFGLGAAGSADRVTVTWPSGLVETWTSIAAGQTILLVEGAVATGVAATADGLPVYPLSIVGNFPNPFNPVTTLVYELPRRGTTDLSIYDTAGREIRRLVRGTLPAGSHSTVWDGRDRSGHPVPSGLYFTKLVFAGEKRTHKILLLR